MNTTTKSIIKYLVEIIIVAFGVFLGVYFSNVNADNKTKIEKAKSLSIIVKELEHNQKLLEKHIDYHENIKVQIDSVSNYVNEKDKYSSFTTSTFKHNELKGWNGFLYARLENTAFESAKISGVMKEYDIELIQEISRIYTMQQTYVDFGSSILNKAFQTNSNTKVVDFIGIIELMTSDLLMLEKKLFARLKNNIADLKLPND